MCDNNVNIMTKNITKKVQNIDVSTVTISDTVQRKSVPNKGSGQLVHVSE